MSFATAGLKDKVRDAEDTWNRRLEDLRDRITAIDAAIAALVPTDPVQAAQIRELTAERRDVHKQIGAIGRTDAHGALTELGPAAELLPDRRADHAGSHPHLAGRGQRREQDLPQRDPRVRRVRPARPCSSSRPGTTSTSRATTTRSPASTSAVRPVRCGSSGGSAPTAGTSAQARGPGHQPLPALRQRQLGDASALHKVLRPVRVTSNDRRDDARISDDSDDRDRQYYERVVRGGRRSRAHRARLVAAQAGRRSASISPAARWSAPSTSASPGPTVQPTDRFAGQDTRIGKFFTCDSCGGTTTASVRSRTTPTRWSAPA